MRRLFAPGCALKKHRPESVLKIMQYLLEKGYADGIYLTCCKDGMHIDDDIQFINCCPGCNNHFNEISQRYSTVSLWSVLKDSYFPFPDYKGEKMSIHDSCHSRNRNSSEFQDSARQICQRMNIELVEPVYTRDESHCCGGCAKDFETRKKMAITRAEDFIMDDVVVYCTGCTRSFSLTDKKPRMLFDLIFNEPTIGLTVEH